jgi:signal transduction histidine kinase
VERDARVLGERELAALERRLAHDRTEERRLACAVRAREREPITSTQAKRDPVEEGIARELLAEARRDDHGHDRRIAEIARAGADELIVGTAPADDDIVKVVVGRSLAAGVVGLGLLTLVGWTFERKSLTSLVDPANLKVNTALCLVALGAAAMLQRTRHERLRTVLEVAAGVLAVATLFEHIRGTSLGIDELLLQDPFTTTGAPGRMSLGSALALALAATGMLGIDSLRRRVRVAAHAPLVTAGAIGLVGLIGYASGLGDLYWKSDVTSMALQAAAGIVVLVTAVFVLAPVEGAIAAVLRPSAGGRLLRRMLPAALLVPAAFVIPIGRGANAGLYGFDVGVLLFLAGTVAVSVPVVFWTARSVDAAEAQRERLLAESRAVLDATTDGILMTDVAGELLLSNAAMNAFWDDVGLAHEGDIWQRIARLAGSTTSPDEYHLLLGAVARHPGREHIGEFTVASSGRSYVGRTAPVRSSSGAVMGRVFSLRETTTERAAARAKEEFVAMVSHELRTPLAAITGYAELLEDDVAELGEESARFLEVVQRNAQRLTRLVDDLLLLQQSETGDIALYLTDVELGELVRQSLERVGPAAEGKSISLSTVAREEVVVRADAMRLGQVVDNLLSNAVKFTPAGGAVEVRLWSTATVGALEVEDSGQGIAADEQDRVFERFFRSRDAVARSIPGTGLGLVVSRRIAEAHGGVLDLVEGHGSGATFRLLVPLAERATAVASPLKAPVHLADRRSE